MIVSMLGSGSAGRKFGALVEQSGHRVVYGARNPDTSADLLTLSAAAKECDLAMITIPFQACYEQLPLLAPHLRGKIVVDTTNPTNNSDWSPILLGQENSAGEEIARLLPQSRVVKTLNTVFAEMAEVHLLAESPRLTGFVAGDDTEAAQTVLNLIDQMGFDPLYVGPLFVSRYLEAMSHLNIELALKQHHGTRIGYIYRLKPGPVSQ